MSQRRITLKVGLLMEWQGTVHSYFLMIQNIFGEGRGERTVQASYSQEMVTASPSQDLSWWFARKVFVSWE